MVGCVTVRSGKLVKEKIVGRILVPFGSNMGPIIVFCWISRLLPDSPENILLLALMTLDYLTDNLCSFANIKALSWFSILVHYLLKKIWPNFGYLLGFAYYLSILPACIIWNPYFDCPKQFSTTYRFLYTDPLSACLFIIQVFFRIWTISCNQWTILGNHWT